MRILIRNEKARGSSPLTSTPGTSSKYLINDEGKKGSHGGHGGHGVLTRNHSVSSFDQNAGEWL